MKSIRLKLSCLFQAMAPGYLKNKDLWVPQRSTKLRVRTSDVHEGNRRRDLQPLRFLRVIPTLGISRHVVWPSLAFYLATIRTSFLASVLAFYLDSIWQSISGVLFPSSSQYYFVLQSLHKVLPSKACTKCFPVPVLLRTAKLAQSTSQYYFGTAHPISKRSKPRSADNGEHSGASRTRRTNEAPHIDAGSHFMRENKGFRAIPTLQASPGRNVKASITKDNRTAHWITTASGARDIAVGPRHAPQPSALAIWWSGLGTLHSHRSLRSTVRVQACPTASGAGRADPRRGRRRRRRSGVAPLLKWQVGKKRCSCRGENEKKQW